MSSASFQKANSIVAVQILQAMAATENEHDIPRPHLTAVRDGARDRQKAWLSKIRSENPGVTWSDIARRAGLSPSTVTRFMNDPTSTIVLSGPVVAAIEKIFGSDTASKSEPAPEIRIARPEEAANETIGPGRKVFQLGVRFGGLAGYRPGDFILADEDTKAVQDGDDVIVSVEDLRGGQTLHLRGYRGRWVFAGQDVSPEYVDGVRIRIIAVVIKSWRTRDVH